MFWFFLVVIILLIASFPFLHRDFEVVFVPTRKADLKKIKEALSIAKDDVVYDLGCGMGGTLAYLVHNTGAGGVGIELAPMLAWLGKFIHRGKITVRQGSYYNADISDATIVYCFLLPGVWSKLVPKLRKDLKPGTRIVSYIFKIDGLEPVQSVKNDKGKDMAYIYRI